jgi:hypothetical protein
LLRLLRLLLRLLLRQLLHIKGLLDELEQGRLGLER